MARRTHCILILLVPLLALVSCRTSTLDVREGESTCLGCHMPMGPDGVRSGIEVAHRGFPLSCIDCHGGDPEADTKEASHVSAGDGPAYIRNFGTLELDALYARNPGYLRFINPTDLRIVDRTCGSGSPDDPGSGCHQSKINRLKVSIMGNQAGHFNVSRYLAGLQDTKLLEVGPVNIVLADCDPDAPPGDPRRPPPGAVCRMDLLRLAEASPDPIINARIETHLDTYLAKGCAFCHQWEFGKNVDPGDYRSGGCAGCHMVYANHGRSASADPAPSDSWKATPPHALKHEITTSIADSQCEHCHYRGARIGVHYRGLSESGALNHDDLYASPVSSGESIHTHGPDFYIVDADDTNDFDETPPDVHHAPGGGRPPMGCVDCHVDQEVHGDGNLYSNMDFQAEMRCETCHGTPEWEPTGPPFLAPRGSPIPKLSRRTREECEALFPDRVYDPAFADCLVLTSRLDGAEHPVTLMARTDYAPSSLDAARLAHVRGELAGPLADPELSEFSHLDGVKCYTCHDTWSETCFGCHARVDDRSLGFNPIDGLTTAGNASGTKGWQSINLVLLGVNFEGLVSLMFPAEKMFFSYTDPSGMTIVDRKVRVSPEGLPGMNYAPMHPHTARPEALACDRCHILEDESNTDFVMEALGFGSGRYIATDGDGVDHDLTKVIEADGIRAVSIGHWGADTLPPDMIDRMLLVRVPMDLPGAGSPPYPRPGSFPRPASEESYSGWPPEPSTGD